MSMMTACGSGVASTRPVRGDLSMLASISALELDRLSRKIPTDPETVRQLVDRLKTILKVKELGNPGFRVTMLDPRTVGIVDRAIVQSNNGQELLALEMLYQAKDVIEKLQAIVDSPEAADKVEVEKMAAFCLELSKTASAHKAHPFNDRGRNPFRG